MSLNLADLFEAVSDAVPEDRVAIVYNGERITYRQLDERANQLAHQLISRGVQPGDHVGLHMRNSPQFIESLLGCLKARAVPININYRYTEKELSYLYDNAQLVALVVDGEFTQAAAAVVPECPKLQHVLVVDPDPQVRFDGVTVDDYDATVRAQSTARDFGERSDDDHFIVYTGGTTGMPKGVVWRQEDFYMAALHGGNHYGDPYLDTESLAAAVKANEFPISFLVTAPLMHGAAVYSLFAAFFTGSKQVVMRNYDPVEALQMIDAEKIMCVMVVGDAICRPLADAIEAHGDEYDLSSVVLIGSGGALWSKSVRDKLTELLPNCYMRDGFGSSESGVDGTVDVGADGALRIPGGPNITVVDERLRPLEAGSDTMGYIARRGNVPLGYFNDPVKSAETFPVVDGVRMSVLGDMGKIEADGTIVLLGRGSMCINTGGEKVFPEEVEQALKAHPAVMDALVAGAPDDKFGERVAAVVELRAGFEGTTVDDIVEHCRKEIAGYKIPRSIVVVPTIVRSPSGKADYRWARATVAQPS
ncbi:acyl-CoA synthetase [Rhodococcus sp. D2-41]|uniref:Acyl-CoA synthetase n=1 Tax=Speluncibacter jeojiensis TaxID=2710754 RepID=A0A9X4M1D6_9ACTN|nr:acyl-CoA synthetase [Rhodococcus sp. D2-41]MDG3011643.1 acyl-CoA synthetase [Rhodococcus sp. D2-41]MDG3015002.1 acyl-CoA synthetase [Corynebacteriales bacterium D3-21]